MSWLREWWLRLLFALDPAWGWCGGCGDADCDDCATEWRHA